MHAGILLSRNTKLSLGRKKQNHIVYTIYIISIGSRNSASDLIMILYSYTNAIDIFSRFLSIVFRWFFQLASRTGFAAARRTRLEFIQWAARLICVNSKFTRSVHKMAADLLLWCSLRAVYEADTCQLWIEIEASGGGYLGSMHTQCKLELCRRERGWGGEWEVLVVGAVAFNELVNVDAAAETKKQAPHGNTTPDHALTRCGCTDL